MAIEALRNDEPIEERALDVAAEAATAANPAAE